MPVIQGVSQTSRFSSYVQILVQGSHYGGTSTAQSGPVSRPTLHDEKFTL